MLILTRRLDEGVLIGDNIRVKIMDLGRRQVRIGIEAPEDVAIYREEAIEEGRESGLRAPRCRDIKFE